MLQVKNRLRAERPYVASLHFKRHIASELQRESDLASFGPLDNEENLTAATISGQPGDFVVSKRAFSVF